MCMKLTDMAAGVFPYQDGSGFAFEVSINNDGEVSIKQSGDHLLFTRKQWPTICSAVNAMFETADHVAAITSHKRPEAE